MKINLSVFIILSLIVNLYAQNINENSNCEIVTGMIV
jgi:hypothetical protein